jgi:hypothetical protein
MGSKKYSVKQYHQKPQKVEDGEILENTVLMTFVFSATAYVDFLLMWTSVPIYLSITLSLAFFQIKKLSTFVYYFSIFFALN